MTKPTPAANNPPPEPTPSPAPAAVNHQERAAAFERLARAFRLEAAVTLEAMRAFETADAWRDHLLDERAAAAEATSIDTSRGSVTRDEGETLREAIENVLEVRAGVPGVKLDKGESYRGLTLVELGRTYLEASGVSVRGRTADDVAGLMIRAPGMHTTADFSVLLGNTAQKRLRGAYQQTPQTFKTWTRGETLPDFKPVTRAAMSSAPPLDEVPEGAEFRYGTMSDGSESYALKTYGKIFAITRQAIVNDDLGAFTRIPAMWGVSAANKESDIVYGVLLDNAALADGVALFHATHGNLGTAAAITDVSLTAAFQAIGAQKDASGNAIVVTPTYLIVGPAKAQEAEKALKAVTATKTADVNIWAGRLTPIVEPRITGNKWFIAADPSTVDTVEYAHLAGREGVYTERREGWNVDGVEFKARLDFAAKAIDFRGLYYNPGA